MALSDDELLNVDASRLDEFDRERAERRLEEQGDVYRAQLVGALWID